MRPILFILLITLTSTAFCQDLITYRDTSYQFEIGIPSGWRYGKPNNYPKLLLMSLRVPKDSTEKFVENFNVNVVEDADSNIDSSFSKLLKYNGMAKDYKVVEKGTITINSQDFRWVISTHTNKYIDKMMYNYVLLTYVDSKAYIITMVSTPESIKDYMPLFEKVALTFKIMSFS